MIFTFATTYFIIGHKVGPVLSSLGSVVFSMTSFHGRGFFPGDIGLDDHLTVVAALEAFIGLLIEVTFISTLPHGCLGSDIILNFAILIDSAILAWTQCDTFIRNRESGG